MTRRTRAVFALLWLCATVAHAQSGSPEWVRDVEALARAVGASDVAAAAHNAPSLPVSQLRRLALQFADQGQLAQAVTAVVPTVDRRARLLRTLQVFLVDARRVRTADDGTHGGHH